MDFELRGKVTIGIVYIDNDAFIIDSGIDENEIRKTLNYVTSNNKKVRAYYLLIITQTIRVELILPEKEE
jgi:hypothetical protein